MYTLWPHEGIKCSSDWYSNASQCVTINKTPPEPRHNLWGPTACNTQEVNLIE